MKVNKKPKELYKIYTVLKSRVLIHIHKKSCSQLYKFTNIKIQQLINTLVMVKNAFIYEYGPSFNSNIH